MLCYCGVELKVSLSESTCTLATDKGVANSKYNTSVCT